MSLLGTKQHCGCRSSAWPEVEVLRTRIEGSQEPAGEAVVFARPRPKPDIARPGTSRCSNCFSAGVRDHNAPIDGRCITRPGESVVAAVDMGESVEPVTRAARRDIR